MRTSNTLAAIMLAMGTLSTALPADPSANGLAARAEQAPPLNQGQGPQKQPFGQGPNQQQQPGYGQQAPQQQYGPGQNDPNKNYGPIYPPQNPDPGCPECENYSHHFYENANSATKSSSTQCQNGCCPCKQEPPKPDCKPEPKPCCRKPHPCAHHRGGNGNRQ
ncbi:unnamed protein product [Clonostachys rosea]|uniref:Uncharacterized protein n=1 Tax=Bionectria ochroleuca TaxID=29856 RepID=A0ABY6ULJ9_BIOOC|nr:unnamed protein product [Clonostachys rosea]